MDDHETPDAPDEPPRGGSILSSGVTASPIDWTAPGSDASGAGATGGPVLGHGLALAGIGTRLSAFLVDGFILASASVIITVMATVVFGDRIFAQVVAALLTVALAIAYFAIFWIGPWAATPGQRLAGLRVVEAVGLRPVGANQALVRSIALGAAFNLVSIAAPVGPFIGAALLAWPFILLATTSANVRRQGLHDRWTRTLVVRPAEASTFPLTLGCFLIVLIILAAPVIIATASGPALAQLMDQVRGSGRP